ncbi:MAG: rod shape-determining protein MreC [Chlorobi bacterium]|nr:rod shape-determining protein MreC [Chlorobiota bacterium]
MELFLRKLFNKLKEYIVLAVLLLISLILLPQNKNTEVKKIKSYAFATFAILTNASSSIGDIFKSSDELEEQRKRNAELMLKLNRVREYALENKKLKELLGYKEEVSSKLFPSTIVAKNFSNIQGNYIINAGISDSVYKSMPVITNDGLVGIVTDTEENFSLVRTLHNTSFRISGTIQRSNIDGIIFWDGQNLVMHNIPTTADIDKGDRVVTSVLSSILPPSIPVGLVVKKESNISGILSNVIIRPFVDVLTVKNIFVLQEVKSKQIDSLELNLLKD